MNEIRKTWLGNCENDPAKFYDLDGEELEDVYGFWRDGWSAARGWATKYQHADGDDAETITEAWQEGFEAACRHFMILQGGA